MRRLVQFFKAFSGDWLALMSGPPTVPLTIAAFFVPNRLLRVLFGCLAVLCAFVASFRVWARERTKVEEEIKELRAFKKEVENEQIQLQLAPDGYHICMPTYGFPYRPSEQGFSLMATFVNNPKPGMPGKPAHQVAAWITYTDADGHSFRIPGRWADTTQPEHFDPLESKTSLLRVDFEVGSEHPLDIAVKFPKDLLCYAVNNESFPDVRRDDRKLVGPLVKVKVELLAEWVNQAFTFEFINHGENHQLEVKN
jgi:hypothetical protein